MNSTPKQREFKNCIRSFFVKLEVMLSLNAERGKFLEKAQNCWQIFLCCSFLNGSNAKRRQLVGTYDCCVKENIGDGCYRTHLKLKGLFCSSIRIITNI